MHRILDIQQNAVPRTSSRSQTQRRKNRNIVASRSSLRLAHAMHRSVHQHVDLARRRIGEDARTRHHCRQFRMRQRHLDHDDRKQRRIRIFTRRAARAPSQFFLRTHARRTRNIDIHIVLILRVDNQRMRMRAAARLHIRHLLRIPQVTDVEDPHPLHPVRAREAAVEDGATQPAHPPPEQPTSPRPEASESLASRNPCAHWQPPPT